MKIRFGLMMKFLLWHLVIVGIFFLTIIFLFFHINQIKEASEKIVNKRYMLSSISKRMMDNLFTMEENEKKYRLLKKEEYKEYYLSAQKEYEKDLLQILRGEWLVNEAKTWHQLYGSYRAQVSLDNGEKNTPSGMRWIPESVRNNWVQEVSKFLLDNEHAVEREMRDLHQIGLVAVRWGIAGVVASMLVGLLGIVFLAHSMNRPLRELRRGIRSLSREGTAKPIPRLSKDEFGELALAFNEMAMRLKEEERMRSDFISMLSHEIRTPLTSIRESVSLISEGVLGEIGDRQRRLLEIAREEIERLTDLLNHLMQVARMEAGALEIHTRPTDPITLVDTSIHRLRSMAEAKGVKILVHLPEGIPRVLADPDHLQQVLLNLVGNAIKFSPPQREVNVRVEPVEADRKLIFSVADMGSGIPDDEKLLVFHKYYRVAGMKNEADGVGLGLSISKYIVEAHGGEIWVESRVGKGSVFSFSIPISPEG